LFLADESLNLMLRGQAGDALLDYDQVFRVIHPDDRARVSQALDDAIATGQPYQCDHRVVTPSGEVRWLRSRGCVYYDRQGRPLSMTGAMADFTELKHAEQSMAILADASRLLAESLDSQQLLSTISRMAVPSFADAVAIHLKDPETGRLSMSLVHAADPELRAAGEELIRSGVPTAAPSRRVMRTGRPELLPRLTPEWLIAEDVDERLAAVIRKFGISSTIHVPIVWAGQPYAVIVFVTAGTRVYNQNDLAFAEELGRRASGAMRNAQLFQTARIERTRAEQAAALREQLVAIVGHDLRNPLASISMAAQTLCQGAHESADQRLAGRIQSSARRMTRLINQILDFARIRAGMSFELQLEPADLRQICTAVIDELRAGRPDREITLGVEGPSDAICDPDRIAQVLSNLVGNALQHGAPGPVSVQLRDAPPDRVAIEVHNFGPPIPTPVQSQIFEAFHREATSGGRRSTSIGLGLYIARQIVQAHGGSITLRSPDRNGTTFTMLLPRKQPPPAGSIRS
jgi:PAS domain S-box-containing protein